MFVIALSLLAACTDQGAARDDASDASSAQRVLEEGSPEALGVLAMVNDRSTTFTLLDVDAALDKRAAQGLITHRDGADALPGTADDNLFDTVQEMDDVAYVGDSALAALLGYARAHGWVSVDEDYYGTIEGVSFTKDQAAAVVDVANTADVTTLDVTIGLDSRAAANLVAGRPFATLEAVAGVSYVGTSALTALVEWVDAAAVEDLSTSEAVAVLTADVSGLYFTSESDYPLLVWQIASPSTTALTSANVRTVLASAYVAHGGTSFASRSVEQSSMSWAFDRYTVAQSWWDESYYAQQPKWQTLRDVFDQQLQDVTVWRFGRRNSSGSLTGDIDVFVVGVTTDGGLVGFSTISIET